MKIITQGFTQFVIHRNNMYFSSKSSNRSLLPETSYRIYMHNQTAKIPKNSSKFAQMKCHIEQEQGNEKRTNLEFFNFQI